jgi:RNA polymerase sigma-70 factor (ECF subfamily)
LIESLKKEHEAVTEQQWLTTYRETVRDLYGYLARRTGGNKELCEDIVQESFLRALESWNRKGLPDVPAAWLKRVAQNILIDYLRRSKWIDQSAIRPETGAVDPPPVDPARSLKIFSAIASLGRKKAAILEAFYYEGKSVHEIAEQTRISERAVEGQLRRARRSLKSLLPDLRSNGGKNE